jgi:cell pole-organizing protein PopZ
MSRDSSGESLEAILASIRRSLSEQATSVLAEEPATPVELLPAANPSADLDMPPFPASLSQRLAAGPHAAPADAAPAAVDGASVLVPPPPRTQVRTPTLAAAPSPAAALAGEPGPMAAGGEPIATPVPEGAPPSPDAAAQSNGPLPPATATAPVAAPAAEPGRKDDPLWFLGQEAGARAAAPPPEPKPSRPGVSRGPLPPFFGSTAEVVKVEMVSDPPARASTGAQPIHGGHEFNGAPSRDTPPRAADAGSARTSSIFGLPQADARGGGAGDAPQPQIQALEAMVAELLRPMLRRCLDENMPRLVSAALKAEADLMSGRDSRHDSGRDPKKP